MVNLFWISCDFNADFNFFVMLWTRFCLKFWLFFIVCLKSFWKILDSRFIRRFSTTFFFEFVCLCWSILHCLYVVCYARGGQGEGVGTNSIGPCDSLVGVWENDEKMVCWFSFFARSDKKSNDEMNISLFIPIKSTKKVTDKKSQLSLGTEL